MVRHQFTPQQANRTLPLVKRIVADILETGQAMRDAGAGKPRPLGDEGFRELRWRLKEFFDELDKIGCSYKDWSFDTGLVDFPSEVDGEEVLLCWRSDEERVSWYHRAEDGFAGRKPIPEELLEE